MSSPWGNDDHSWQDEEQPAEYRSRRRAPPCRDGDSQLTELVKEAPGGRDWLRELKFDGYRIPARLDHGSVRLLTRTGLDWTHKYPSIAKALRARPAWQAYLDGELCGVRPNGTTSFDMIQAASEPGNAAALVFFFLFDLLHLNGEDLLWVPLRDRKARLQWLLGGLGALQYSDHQTGRGPSFTPKRARWA